MTGSGRQAAAGRRALVAGATGLVGGFCVRRLLAHPAWDRVTVLSRRALDLENPRLDVRLVDFEDLPGTAGALEADDAFCCLGTTMAQAGSRDAFARVDRDYVSAFARLARRSGVQRFLLVSAIGASPRSAFFYYRIKGEAEAAVTALGFEAVHVFRPSLLLGRRSEFRLGEALGQPVARLLTPLLPGTLRRHAPVQADTVAATMLEAAASAAQGVVVHHFPD